MPRRRPVDLSTNHERWLVSYSDFVTLLFAFFVVMYSISQVSESKYRVLSETLTTVFDDRAPALSLDPINIGTPVVEAKPSVLEGGGEFDVDHIMPGDGAFDKTADLPQLSDLFEDEFSDLIEDELVQIHSNEMWLEVELKSSVLFDSAEATPTRAARSIFQDIAQLLKNFENPIQVEGFTDNVPISNARYASNWELSSARAAAAVKLMVDAGVDPKRLAAVGYGEYQPVADNSTEQGRAANRRVVLMIAREKTERPNVQSMEEIERAVEPPQKQTFQPYPQPGLQLPDQNSDVDQISPLNETDLKEPETAADNLGVESEPLERLAPVGEIRPVETKSGGLLFTSDPDLPRN